MGEKMSAEIGAGNRGSHRKATNPLTTVSPPKGKRSADDQAHCYEPQDAQSLSPRQCDGEYDHLIKVFVVS